MTDGARSPEGAGAPVEGPRGRWPRLADLSRVRDIARSAILADQGRRSTRLERIALLLIVLVPVLLNAIALLPELTIPVPSVNDDELHYLFVQNASAALANGQNIFDHWLPQIEAGFPQFVYYQHLPTLAVVGLERLSLGALDLLTAFNLIRYVLLVALPVTVFVSMRTMGLSSVAAALGAASSTLLSGDFRYGFEYDSYIWRGFGMYTQLWAMHLSFLTLAAMYQALQFGRRVWVAALLFGLLVLTHLIYAYMLAMAVVLIVLWGLSRANVVSRVKRVSLVTVFAGAISSYMWLPLLSQTAFLNATPYLQPEKYASYGAGPILTWLASGDLLDHGRLPVLTVLLAFGVVAAVVSRAGAALLMLAAMAMWLIVYFGRPTLGNIVDFFPLHDGLLLHRFIGGVELAAIVVIGLGGALLWQLWQPHRAPWRLLGGAMLTLAILSPAMAERATFYSFNTQWEQRSLVAVRTDFDAQAILRTVRTLPPGRVFAGLPATYGNAMAFQDLHFYNLLAFEGIENLNRPIEALSLNSDYIWDFDDSDPADFDLFNVRYLIAPSDRSVATFLTPIHRTSRYTLYEAPTSGYAQYVTIASRRAVSSKTALFDVNLIWERSTLPAERLFLRLDYPATESGPLSAPDTACVGDGRIITESFKAGEIDVVVECASASTLVFKTTFHPNWEVTVDGAVSPDFMVSPSFIGVDLSPGRHTVQALYRPTPLKMPLLVLGVVALALLVMGRRRLDRLGA